jgi:hypothetical protein
MWCHGVSLFERLDRFGEGVMVTMVDWTVDLLSKELGSERAAKQAAILDVGTGNGVLPLQFAKRGFLTVTGTLVIFHNVSTVLLVLKPCDSDYRHPLCAVLSCFASMLLYGRE